MVCGSVWPPGSGQQCMRSPLSLSPWAPSQLLCSCPTERQLEPLVRTAQNPHPVSLTEPTQVARRFIRKSLLFSAAPVCWVTFQNLFSSRRRLAWASSWPLPCSRDEQRPSVRPVGLLTTLNCCWLGNNRLIQLPQMFSKKILKSQFSSIQTHSPTLQFEKFKIKN